MEKESGGRINKEAAISMLNERLVLRLKDVSDNFNGNKIEETWYREIRGVVKPLLWQEVNKEDLMDLWYKSRRNWQTKEKDDRVWVEWDEEKILSLFVNDEGNLAWMIEPVFYACMGLDTWGRSKNERPKDKVFRFDGPIGRIARGRQRRNNNLFGK